MLSVLIPTYHYNTLFLVEKIHEQLLLENIVFEVICFDDGSKSELNTENEKINTLIFGSFNSLENNIGRSAIRNLLAEKAQYKWLLFLDADVVPVNSIFFKKYIACFKKNKTVFCGGLLYQNKKENLGLLRYKYGKKHEEISVEKRKINPEKYFFSSNFLLEKKVFNSVRFEEKLIKYGREDLLFSLGLVKKGYKIEHLENEVYHLGIEENKQFVAKTKKAMENLLFLVLEELIEEEEIAILNFTNNIEKIKMAKIAGMFYPIFEKLAVKGASVFFLDVMKVCYLCHLKSKHA
ncbi:MULTISPECIES: glycosyltransferase family 2 protein [unclassified Polaribacter]|uniref:glycosyltransferase family 2 protein n=1 Tax=unclassified Polaribacter TaxID=196858 RepID=UPI0011BE25C9|nr:MULTISPECIES: glycosyltransferase family A protein [unclassified Polaribacter]TXD53330.1 glycosyltransferase family 2 protein [Polaribacter sp. IC063]TXD57163.1 glycosyltransferase family 2 protein [Polaribacter sp. IC066]